MINITPDTFFSEVNFFNRLYMAVNYKCIFLLNPGIAYGVADIVTIRFSDAQHVYAFIPEPNIGHFFSVYPVIFANVEFNQSVFTSQMEQTGIIFDIQTGISV